MEFLLDDEIDIDLDSLAPTDAGPAPAAAEAARADGDVAAKSPPENPVAEDAWFEAASAFGSLWLCVQTGAPALHAAAAAVVLQQAGPMLDALDDWSVLELDWRWTPVPQAADAGSHVVVRWPDDDAAPVAAHLVLPWTLVRQLQPPTGTLADSVRWEPAQATVVVARLTLGGDELDTLEPGGAVVLPDSMRSDWRGVLRARGEPLDAGAPLALTPPHAPQVVPRDQAVCSLAPEAGAVICEVRLDSTPMVAVDRLAGWAPGDIGDLGIRASLWRCDGTPRRCAGGVLLRWGDGWALGLDTV